MKRALGFMNKSTPNPLNDIVIAAYHLEDAIDSKNGYNGTVFGSPTFPAGKNGNCFSNTGSTSNYINYINLSSITASKNSLNFWVKLNLHTPIDIVKTGSVLFNTESSSSHYPYTNGNIYCCYFTSVRKTIGVGIVADRTQWHMVTVTANIVSNVWKFYQNGTLVTTSTVGTFTFSSNCSIGAGPGVAIDGRLDELTVFSDELTQAQINELYNSGAGKFYPF